MLKGVDETLAGIVECVENELIKIEAPVCTASSTVGSPVIGSCCDCGDGEGELWGGTIRVYRMGASAGGYPDEMPKRPCAPSMWAAEFQITLARCFPVLDDYGELPPATERASSAAGLHADIAAIQRAIHCCSTTEPPYLVSIGVDTDPEGGCSYLVAVVQVPVSLKRSDNQIN